MPDHQETTRGALQAILGDKYEIGPWIGGGGMAEVFLARHRGHGGLFAVKVLADHLSREPRIVARFLEEARTASTLSGHANIVPVFDIGDAGGLHYLIMPYVEGEDVKSYLESRGRLPGAEAAYIARQVAEALVWAAERRVVHRDLKPANIRIDTSGRVLVLDFGIAKAQDASTGLTRATETLGTPYYMSPEQILAKPCDVRSDLYSLGVVLYELLSGRKPFSGETYREIEQAHLAEERPVLEGTGDAGLEAIVHRLLEKDPEDRFPDAASVVAALRATASGQYDVKLQAARDFPGWDGGPQERMPVVAPEIPTVPPAPPAAPAGSARRWVVPVAAAGLVGAVLAGVLWFRSGETPPPAPPEEKKPAAELAKVVRHASGTMFLVPGGKFVFGDDAPEAPNKRQQTELPAFYLDATEVPNEVYAGFARATGRPVPEGAAVNPVTGVTHGEAAAFCAWAQKRLPTEAEWEKAGRGADGRVYPWGNQALESPGKLVAVDEYPDRQSPTGHLGMSGNVFEWTASPFPVTEAEIEDMQKLRPGATVSRQWFVVKGGTYLQKNELFSRLYMRRGWPVDQGAPVIGFRCAKDATP